ncbi:MAG: hypothetical protein ACE5JX_16575, partial [Acidobacteriota bacterium]
PTLGLDAAHDSTSRASAVTPCQHGASVSSLGRGVRNPDEVLQSRKRQGKSAAARLEFNLNLVPTDSQ